MRHSQNLEQKETYCQFLYIRTVSNLWANTSLAFVEANMECKLEKKRAFALRIGFGLLANATLHFLHYQQGSNWVTDCMSVQFTAGILCLAALFSSSPSIHTFPSPLSS